MLSRNLLLLSLVAACIAGSGCKKKNEAVLALPDLSIPEQFPLLDPDGKPILDPNGQPIVDYNELYYNHRTGEFFTHLFPSIMGVLPGDILDVASRVFNAWVDKPEAICADAPSTTANSVLIYSGSTDSDSVKLAPGIVPAVPCNSTQGSLIYNTLTFNSPGVYKIYFAANHDRKVPEHDYTNNYTHGASASLFDRSINGGIVVSEGVASGPWASSNIPTREVAHGTCFRQFDSGTMAEFVKFKAENPDRPFLLN
jgi:hypothetical protein